MLLADIRYERVCRKRLFYRGLLRALESLYRGTGFTRNLLHAMQTFITIAVYLILSASSSQVQMVLQK
jgi:hypothetical protein